MPAPDSGSFPTAGELNDVSVDEFSAAVALLFEPAPRFAAWLAAARPFRSDDELMAAAARIARSMSRVDQIELVNAHPRLGTRDRLSTASEREQGDEDDPVDEELAKLNATYERRFGFRYLVYVDGRSRAELLPRVPRRARPARGCRAPACPRRHAGHRRRPPALAPLAHGRLGMRTAP